MAPAEGSRSGVSAETDPDRTRRGTADADGRPAPPASFTRAEWRAILSLSCVYALRFMGLYMVLPVLSLYARRLPGSTSFLTGMSLGAYGFTNMLLRLWQDGGPRDVLMREGDVLLLPPHVPHSPQRPEPDSLGLVVERVRPEGVLDRFNWYCDSCRAMHHQIEIHVKTIMVDLPRLMND